MAGYGQHRRKDYTGQRCTYLTAIRDVGSTGKKRLWLCRCDCGREITITGAAFNKRQHQSCGCRKNELIGKALTRHGLSKHPLHAVWNSMWARCTRTNHPAFRNYGGRGITVCKRWKKFENFWSDMSPTYQPGLTLERKNNNRGYTLGNCVWASRQQQARNRRSNRMINTPWGTLTVQEANRRAGFGWGTLSYRIHHGWPEKDWSKNRVLRTDL